MKFKLFLGYLGNGVTVCNSAIEEYGDYKKIAHISSTGHIKWYVDYHKYVPEEDLERIFKVADKERLSWEEWFNKKTKMAQYMFLLDKVKLSDFIKVTQMDCDVDEKIRFLKKQYLNQH